MIKLTEKDLHVHTVYCPHRRAADPMEDYLHTAEARGLREISFTEHAPFCAPISLTQYKTHPTLKDEQMGEYFDALHKLRETYRGPVAFNIGLEYDYLEGFEEEIVKSLERYGPSLEDSLLAIHNLWIKDRFYNLCYPENLPQAIEAAGSARRLLELYYASLIRSMQADLGPYKPRRIAHPTQIKFSRLLYPEFDANLEIMDEVVKVAKERGYSLEINTSGATYPSCQEYYGISLLPQILKYQAPVTLGSDAHQASRVGEGFRHPVILQHLDELHPYWEEPCT